MKHQCLCGALLDVLGGKYERLLAALEPTEENIDRVARVIPAMVGQGPYVRECARLVLETIRDRAGLEKP